VAAAFAMAINAGATAYAEPKVMFWGQTIAGSDMEVVVKLNPYSVSILYNIT
jgi:hypothetical protein